MKRNDIKIAVMGSSQIEHIIPILIESGYQVTNIQNIFSSNKSKEEKELLYRKVISECDMLYNVYSGSYFWAKASYAKLIGKKVVTHWIGTDVLNAISGEVGFLGHPFIDCHFVCFEPLKEELQSIGIKATVLPIVPFNMNLSVGKMPDTHAVMIYMPEHRLEHYGYKELCYVFEQFPNVPFHIVANSGGEIFKKYGNVTAHGWLDKERMEALYDKVSIVVRFIKHDGLSMSVIEGLIKGKKVIWNNRYYGVAFAESKEAVCRELKEILKTSPYIDSNVSRYVKNELSKDKIRQIFDDAVENIFE
ncbi:MAG: glycosyltransferase family 4 protein [Lachnospiraceae bacterium]|nr:glycosyltransferase family 4 protein [Lachnospiraceae bacterium]